jgi:hypothetical protein
MPSVVNNFSDILRVRTVETVGPLRVDISAYLCIFVSEVLHQDRNHVLV